MAELWQRPWALVDLARRHRAAVEDRVSVPTGHRAALWLYLPTAMAIDTSGKLVSPEPVVGFSTDQDRRRLLLVPLPLKNAAPSKLRIAGHELHVTWPELPDRPPGGTPPQTPQEHRAHALFQRAQAVWDRLGDVDAALSDPARLWDELRKRWAENDQSFAQKHVIVDQARKLSRLLDELDRAPRRILRRNQALVPLSRVQELDRRAMAWLVKQPGETLAERAGDRQKIRAVTREENFDTLENRVLRAYAELARHVAQDYVERNKHSRNATRTQRVGDYGRQCKRLARDLAERGVRLAEPGVMPNFALQENPRYRQIWQAWHALLQHKQILDELWRWQHRSWEEFCALALMVAVSTIDGADLLASSPLSFRSEQHRGCWIEHDNPLGAFHLPKERLVLEVRYRMAQPRAALADFAAPITIRFGSTDDALGFLSEVLVWPVWDADGGLVPGEIDEIGDIIAARPKLGISGAVVMRPADRAGAGAVNRDGALAITIGPQGEELWSGIRTLSAFFSTLVQREAHR